MDLFDIIRKTYGDKEICPSDEDPFEIVVTSEFKVTNE